MYVKLLPLSAAIECDFAKQDEMMFETLNDIKSKMIWDDVYDQLVLVLYLFKYFTHADGFNTRYGIRNTEYETNQKPLTTLRSWGDHTAPSCLDKQFSV